MQIASASMRCRLKPSQWLRLLLALLMWQAPLPWCHAHSIEAEGLPADAWLLNHVREHHAAQSRELVQPVGWHWHYIMPWHVPGEEPLSEDGSSQPGLPNLLISDCGVGTRVDLLSIHRAMHVFTMAGLPLPSNADLVSCVPYVGCVWHFFESFAPSLSVPQRFCIARC
jgi:hypothetical protein